MGPKEGLEWEVEFVGQHGDSFEEGFVGGAEGHQVVYGFFDVGCFCWLEDFTDAGEEFLRAVVLLHGLLDEEGEGVSWVGHRVVCHVTFLSVSAKALLPCDSEGAKLAQPVKGGRFARLFFAAVCEKKMVLARGLRRFCKPRARFTLYWL
jgi:hypothetical protein